MSRVKPEHWLTLDEYLASLREGFLATWGSDEQHRWHPEDLRLNLEIVMAAQDPALAREWTR